MVCHPGDCRLDYGIALAVEEYIVAPMVTIGDIRVKRGFLSIIEQECRQRSIYYYYSSKEFWARNETVSIRISSEQPPASSSISINTSSVFKLLLYIKLVQLKSHEIEHKKGYLKSVTSALLGKSVSSTQSTFAR